MLFGVIPIDARQLPWPADPSGPRCAASVSTGVATGLSARNDTLAEPHPGSRAVTRLRWLQHSIDNRHTELAAGRLVQLATDEENSLTVTLASLRACSTATTRTARTPSAATATATAAMVGRWPH
jgi:hypothetical protein